MSYTDDMRIDENALDLEWLDQAELALQYGEIWAEANRQLEQAIEEEKIIRSELIKKANENPDRCLGEDVKPTGPNVEAYFRNHKKHKAIKQRIINLQYEVRMAEIAKNEVSFTRKAALENLVMLHGQQYFAGPKIPRNLQSERKKRDKVQSKGISEKLNRTR